MGFLSVAGTLAVAGQGLSPARAPHKLKVGSEAAALVQAAGGRFVADYSSYKVFELEELGADLATNSLVEVRDDFNRLLLNSGAIDTATWQVDTLRPDIGQFTGRKPHLVQFAGPIKPEWRAELEKTGARLVSYIPQNAYLLYGDAAALGRLQKLVSSSRLIQWQAAFTPELKICPAAWTNSSQGSGSGLFAVQMVEDAEQNPVTLALVGTVQTEPPRHLSSALGYLNMIAAFPASELAKIAERPDVVSIQPYAMRKRMCERQDQILAGNLSGYIPSGPGYLPWLADKGFSQEQFDASGFVVDLVDSGVDDGTTTPNHFGLYRLGNRQSSSRVVYNILEGTPNPASTLAGCDGHGNLNAHIIAGYSAANGFPFTDTPGYHYGLGVCPFVRLGSSVIFDPALYTFPDLTKLNARAYAAGCRISNNSWGGGEFGLYDFDAQNIDSLVRDAEPDGSEQSVAGNQELVMVFAAGNDGPGAGTVTSPGTAKNVISVGASESVQSIGGTDNAGVDDSGANRANDVIAFSSRGPCSDGRRKPDLLAPGSHVSGGVPQASTVGANGTALGCFDGTGIAGGAGGAKFFPSGQQFYSVSSGTSHATPGISGACALVRQWFVNHFGTPPSPAMTKAFLMNSARYLTGSYANDSLWSDVQGMGAVNLGTAFDGAPRILRDQLRPDLFTASGQKLSFTGHVSETNKPFRVTLAWTDAPGSTVGSAYNNDLDLVVTVGGAVYKGNVFSEAYSTTGGSADQKNNVESVSLPAGHSGDFTVTVTAANINSDGVPNNDEPLDQDFALVIYNGWTEPKPELMPTGSTLQSESYPANGAIDPGETVTVSFGLQNFGTAPTTNLVAMLESGGGVQAPSPAQSYGAIPVGGSVVTRPFTFTAGGSCGATLTATLRLSDGAVQLGTAVFRITQGLRVTSNLLAEDFDVLPAPALPPGWSTVTSGAGQAWITSPVLFSTGPNSVYAYEPDQPGESALVSPPIQVQSASAVLSFGNYYDVEADPDYSTMAYDGGALEISIGGGSFTDILAAGGSFIAGGYNRIVEPTEGNPLAGRRVWSGKSGGFITTKVQLPAAVAGQSIRLKWRFGTDTGNANGAYGWFIDSIAVLDTHYVCAAPLIPPDLTDIRLYAGGITFSFQTAPGQNYTVEYAENLGNSTWVALQSISGDGQVAVVSDSPPATRFYRVRSP